VELSARLILVKTVAEGFTESIDQRFFFVAKIRHLAIKKKCPATWSVQFFEKSPKKLPYF
jgi:hypothetical protein